MKLTEVVAKKKVPFHDIPPPCDKLTFIDALKKCLQPLPRFSKFKDKDIITEKHIL